MSTVPRIVVLTPVKNEEWILERFLSVTSQFADVIVVADQGSEDSSREICQSYSKVILVDNQIQDYDEAERQKLLIQKAREIVPQHKILLALDADEILAANAMETLGWQTMLRAKPGTILYFEKPDLFFSPDQCIRYSTPWPVGYVDDGVEHEPNKVHSIRIPRPYYAHRLYLHDVKILHYALTRSNAQASKARFYSVIENISKTQTFLSRRRSYGSKIDWTKAGKLEMSLQDWFLGWERLGIDMKSIVDQKYYWWDFEVLKYFEKYGIPKFWLDDIWYFDWENCRLYARSLGMKGIPDYKISNSPTLLAMFLDLLTYIYIFFRKHMSSFFSLIKVKRNKPIFSP